MILAGDIGGTKTLLGLFADAPRPRQLAMESFATLDFDGLPAIVDLFLSVNRPERPIERAAFGVAGPVIEQSAEMTNVPWRVDAAELRQRFNVRHVRLLNDLEAMAYGVPVLEPSELRSLQAGTRSVGGNIALIAAGTGLGTSLLHWIDDRYIPVASEGGHTDFAARTDREIEFVRFLRDRFGRAEIEQVLSGPGLMNLAAFSHQGSRCAATPDGPSQPAEVSAAALTGACAPCVEALDMFVAAYGAVAGNFALTAVTRGGVFIGGGIAPRILAALERGSFLQSFNAKEPMDALLRAMPIDVILNPNAGLLGAAVFAHHMR